MPKQIREPGTYLYPLPVVLVSCGVGDEANIITLSWVGTVCSTPPMIGIGVRPSRHSHHLIREVGEFVVNLPTADQAREADYCGRVSGKGADKWAACRFTRAAGTRVRVPLIAECPVNIECHLRHIVPLGSHDLFIGEVVAVHVDEAVLDTEGRVDFARLAPFLYTGRDYRRLGERLAPVGFSLES
ncbi:MAG: flavin reductase family protein [Anaerolineae bacterium]|jgi:flavin reductase (DIM6/NTAB) family NADH-FMN oxidoreductase RutF